MNYIFALVVLLSLADIIGASRQRDRDVQQRSRPDTPPNVRAFDDFLIELIYGVKSLDDLENDSLPRDIPNTETNAIPSNSSESNETEVATTTTEATRSNPLHNTFRNYARRHRPSVANEQSDVRALAEEALMRGDEPIRRHSRRNLDLDIVMAELRGVPREHWSCCNIGFIAGDKGFSCASTFYAQRVLSRNANRVHNRRLQGSYFNRRTATPAGQNLMELFDRCVTTQERAELFETCCEKTLAEYGERTNRWHEFRRLISSVLQE